jgi:hypothetical protein
MRSRAPGTLFQVLLLHAVVLALAGDGEPERIAIERRLDSVSETTIAVWSIPRKRRSFACQRGSPFPGGKARISSAWPSGSLK